MKKSMFIFLGISLFAAGIVSCGKTNRNKLSNEWKVTSFEETLNNIPGSGSPDVLKTVMDETAITKTSNSVELFTGTVKTNDFLIKDDGTWTKTVEYTYPSSQDTSITVYSNQSGTWSFSRKSKGDDLKKNERVIFNLLTEVSKSVKTATSGTQTPNWHYTTTFLTGERPMILVVKESKKKELQLASTGNQAISSSSSGSYTFMSDIKMTLKQK